MLDRPPHVANRTDKRWRVVAPVTSRHQFDAPFWRIGCIAVRQSLARPSALESPWPRQKSDRDLRINFPVVCLGEKSIHYLNGQDNAFVYTSDSFSNVCCSSLPQEQFINDSGLLHRSCGKGLELCTDRSKQHERNTSGQWQVSRSISANCDSFRLHLVRQ